MLKFLFNIRSSHLRCFVKRAVFKIAAIFTEKHLCWSLFLIKLQILRPPVSDLRLLFSCVIYKFFKNTHFEDHLPTTASETCFFTWVDLFDNLNFWLKFVAML